MSAVVGIGVVGAAGWGENVVRAFHGARGAELRFVCDLNPELIALAAQRYPGVKVGRDAGELFADPSIDAVAVAVDAPSHHALAKRALEAGRHVLVEKPLALTIADAEELCTIAERRRRVLMVGHLLLYHPAVERAKACIDGGELGDVLYLYSQRLNLGIVRETENAWWSLAPHDVAVAIHLFGATPVSVTATGGSYLQRGRGIEDIAFASLRFADGRLAHLHVSWLDPHKRRSLTVVGSRRMLTFDDTAADEKVKIYDRGAVPRPGHTSYAEGVAVRSGDVVSPALPRVEPLRAECEHFAACAASGARPRSDGRQGLDVVRVLAAGERSMRQGGAPVEIA